SAMWCSASSLRTTGDSRAAGSALRGATGRAALGDAADDVPGLAAALDGVALDRAVLDDGALDAAAPDEGAAVSSPVTRITAGRGTGGVVIRMIGPSRS